MKARELITLWPKIYPNTGLEEEGIPMFWIGAAFLVLMICVETHEYRTQR